MVEAMARVGELVEELTKLGYGVGMVRVTNDPGYRQNVKNVQPPYVYVGFYDPAKAGFYRTGRGWKGPRVEGRNLATLLEEVRELPMCPR